MSRRRAENRRVLLLPWGVAALFIGAAVSQGRVQVTEREQIIHKAELTRRFVVSRTESARRGTIFSMDGKILAQSEDAYVLGLDYSKIPHSSSFFMALGNASGIAPSEMQQAAFAGLASRTWRRRMTGEQAAEVKAVKSSWRADGVSIHRDLQRDYPLAEATAGVLGAVREGKAVNGIEAAMNDVLEGKDGKRSGMVDRTGAWLPSRMTDATEDRKNGRGIVLTLDSNLQVAATNAVRKSVEANKADRGVAIAMDPHTGDILAMANWPTFDPNGGNTSLGEQVSDLNPNFQSIFEPGSTFKILTLAKALDEGVVDDKTVVTCRLILKIGKAWQIGCDRKHGAHGPCNLERAIAKSCNVSAATWALRVGYPEMVRYIEDLGLLQRSGLGMPYEVRGRFNYGEYAKPLQIAQVGFGQSLNATPIALCSAYAMLANDGIRPLPRLVSEIGGTPLTPEPGKKIVKPEVARKMMHIMEAVIQSDEGTGATLRIPGYRLAGKTGTAQKTNLNTKSMVGGGYVSSFVGYVPAEKPRAVVLVMIDNPKAQYYGSKVAGPVFREIASAIIHRFDIPRSGGARLKVEISAKPAPRGNPTR
jgi:cell division protein FtsI/penicillin-binding protein 2